MQRRNVFLPGRRHSIIMRRSPPIIPPLRGLRGAAREAPAAKIDPLGHKDDVSGRTSHKVSTSAELRSKTLHQQLLALNTGRKRSSVKGIVTASRRRSQLVEARYVAEVECIPSNPPSLQRQSPEVATRVLVAEAESALVALSQHLQTGQGFRVTPSQTSCLMRTMQQVLELLQSDDAVLTAGATKGAAEAVAEPSITRPSTRERPSITKPSVMRASVTRTSKAPIPEGLPPVNSVTAPRPSDAAPPEGWRACPDIPGALVRVSEEADVEAEAVEAETVGTVEAVGTVETVEAALGEARAEGDAMATQPTERETGLALEAIQVAVVAVDSNSNPNPNPSPNPNPNQVGTVDSNPTLTLTLTLTLTRTRTRTRTLTLTLILTLTLPRRSSPPPPPSSSSSSSSSPTRPRLLQSRRQP